MILTSGSMKQVLLLENLTLNDDFNMYMKLTAYKPRLCHFLLTSKVLVLCHQVSMTEVGFPNISYIFCELEIFSDFFHYESQTKKPEQAH